MDQASSAADQTDLSAVKSGQAMTGMLLSGAFVTGWLWLALAVGAVNLISSLAPPFNPWVRVYRGVLRPLGIRPILVEDDPSAHRFAQGFSGVVTLAGAALVALSVGWAGWILVLLVVVLAAINVTVGFCMGCFTYRALQSTSTTGGRA